MTITELREHPEYLEFVIQWINDEFGTDCSTPFYRGIIEHSMSEKYRHNVL